jgi:predicted phosphodiesterase
MTGSRRIGCERRGGVVSCAIISDVHSNREALAAVLARIDDLRVEKIFCLGDVVGYNADPAACMDMVLSRAAETVRGNHDKGVAGLMDLDWFNAAAREAALWTRRSLSPEYLGRLRTLREGPHDVGEGILLCHGTPYDEDAYLMDAGSMAESRQCLEADHPGIRICFHGHTHCPLVVYWKRGDPRPHVRAAAQERVVLDKACSYLINPGSVGQPRDGIAWASFGILDTKRMVYQNLRVEYPVRETQRRMHAEGLPAALARRLAEGR